MGKHDSSYKLFFSHRKMVADLLSGLVHEDWAERLDLSTLQRVREIGISHDLREREDDVIWLKRVLLPARLPGIEIPELNELQEIHDMLAERVKTWTHEWKEQGLQEGLQRGMEQGMQEGMREGKHQGKAELLHRLLARRFGSVPAWADNRLEQAGDADLDAWADRILEGRSLEEVFGEAT